MLLLPAAVLSCIVLLHHLCLCPRLCFERRCTKPDTPHSEAPTSLSKKDKQLERPDCPGTSPIGIRPNIHLVLPHRLLSAAKTLSILRHP